MTWSSPESDPGSQESQESAGLWCLIPVSFLLCSAGLGEVGLREARKGDGAG